MTVKSFIVQAPLYKKSFIALAPGSEPTAPSATWAAPGTDSSPSNLPSPISGPASVSTPSDSPGPTPATRRGTAAGRVRNIRLRLKTMVPLARIYGVKMAVNCRNYRSFLS
jgi:hypothetical protein